MEEENHYNSMISTCELIVMTKSDKIPSSLSEFPLILVSTILMLYPLALILE